MKPKSNVKTFIALHLLLVVFSLSSVCSKMASTKAFMSIGWIIFYGLVIALLGIYAIGWQQIIKRIPLSTAYANKAITVLWGLIWGMLIFGEKPTLTKLIACLLIICGTILFSSADKEAQPNE
ncbi:MAG: transporter [Oscillospiraceae bacterium]